ncbi:MAG: hypothetical protein MJZ76_06910, partial [Bacteroidales bacterium]|nr:hypothetical protein [Bacteroidales bacterium]
MTILPLIVFFLYHTTKAQTPLDSLHPIELQSVGASWTQPNGEESLAASNITEENSKKNAGNGSIN